MKDIGRPAGCAMLVLFIAAGILLADGSRRIFTGVAGPFVITAFSPSGALRAGTPENVSVMVENAADRNPVLDAKVMIHAVRTDGGNIVEVVAPANHQKATNKLLYAGNLTLAVVGKWRMTVEVSGKEGFGTASGEIDVQPPKAPLETYWPFVILIPLVALLFAVNRRLRGKNRLRRQPAQP